MKKILLVAVLTLLASAPQFAHATDDGTPSTGSFTVVYSTNLAAATATGSLTIISTISLPGTSVHIGPYAFKAGRDFTVGASSNATAINLATAINAFVPYGSAPYLFAAATITSPSNTVNLTASAGLGSLGNKVQVLTSSAPLISVSGAFLTGGLNNASVLINGISLVQGRDWFALDSSSNTAISLAAAINHAPALKNLVSGYWTGTNDGIVYLRSLLVPTAYPISAIDNSATNANLTPSAATMVGNSSVGNLAINNCYLGALNALPTSGYPAGCIAYLNSAPTSLYISTQAVTGTSSWLAK